MKLLQNKTTSVSYTNSTAFVAAACPAGTIGTSCSVASDLCSMTNPCLNSATCQLNSTLEIGYYCICVTGFSGTYCELNHRSCRPGVTCLNGGACNGAVCVCPTGKDGAYCQNEVSICGSIKCENDAQCVSNYGNWSCRCTNNELYSGIYCEIESSSLRAKQLISRSLASVAIGCLVAVITFVILMDVLKYWFKIDPVHKDVDASKNKNENNERKKKSIKPKQPVIAVRFRYIHG
ncbi:unnamed protein product [Rotaria magnacalcarata]|uniref:EGF-like domain-containing protein n=1 Tax=Rotaria magnacalcarata TaxID=392030 RepID=A0A8S3HBT4_9BILA|nr:unnamed protein product [Rotaria magnacalcarata]